MPDPWGKRLGSGSLENVVWCEDPYAAIEGADALVILTEWNEFRALDIERVKRLMKAPVMVDLRNVYEPDEMAAAGFRYVCLGRGVAPPDSSMTE